MRIFSAAGRAAALGRSGRHLRSTGVTGSTCFVQMTRYAPPNGLVNLDLCFFPSACGTAALLQLDGRKCSPYSTFATRSSKSLSQSETRFWLMKRPLHGTSDLTFKTFFRPQRLNGLKPITRSCPPGLSTRLASRSNVWLSLVKSNA